MKDKGKSKEQLINELAALRQQIAELKASETRRNGVEKETWEKEERFLRRFASAVTDVIYRYDPINKQYDFISPSFELQSGYSLREIKADPPGFSRRVTHPEDVERVFQEVEDHIMKGPGSGPFRTEYRVIRKDGQIIWVSELKDVEFTPEGKVHSINGVVRDITERKRAEGTLRESEERHRMLFESSPDGIVIATLDGKILDANQGYQDMLGYTLKELKDMTYQQLTPERWHQKEQEAVKSFISGKGYGHFEKEYVKKDGTVFPISLTGWIIKNNHGNPEKIGVFVRDITERKKVEETLKQSERDHRGLFESAHDAIIIFVPETETILDANQRACDIYGYSRSEFIGVSLEKISEDVSRGKRHIKVTLDKGSYHHFETTQYRKDGTEMFLEINASVVNYKGQRAILSINRDITERKKAEAAHRTLVENSLQGLAILEGYKIDFVNPALAEMLGYTVEELMSFEAKDWKKAVPPEDQKFVLKRYADRIRGKEVPSRYEFRMLRKDGTVLWVEMYTSRIEYDGKPAIQAAFVDITERKKAEEALRESQELYKTLVKTSPDAVTVTDLEGRIVEVSQRTLQLHGFENAEELFGRAAFELIAPEDHSKAKKNLQKTLKEGSVKGKEYSLLRKDGTRFIGELNATLIRDAYDKPRAFIATVRDVTQRKRAESILRESEEKFRNLAEQSPNMIFINKKGRAVYANKKCEEMMGYKREEFYSPDFDFFTLISPESKDLIKSNFSRHMKGEEVASYEYALITKEGGRIEAILTTKLIKYEGENAILGTVTDVTERKKMEAELLKAKKLESVGILAGGIAHDFNNILTGILGNISLAKTEVDSKDDIFNTLIKAEKASLRAKDLTQQLLTFSKGGAPIRKTTSIAELMEDSVSFALRGSKVACQFLISDELWPSEIDEGQINQVINNLIINADQAMPEGGIIKMGAENMSVGAEDRLPLPDGRYVKITIQDQGIGIPKQHLQKIFDPYFTTKHKGDGLGLTTSYSIIKNHNGYIAIESELGVGTTFFVYLPASSKKIPKKKPAEKTPLAGRGRVLVMDDEEAVRDVVGDLLKILGYEVEFAEDGDEMIGLYRKAKESAQPFDAVIMDLTVPGGMGGKESIQKLITIDPEVKAVVSSGYSNDPVMADCRKYGFRGVVAKPYKIEELSQVLHKVVMDMSKSPV